MKRPKLYLATKVIKAIFLSHANNGTSIKKEGQKFISMENESSMDGLVIKTVISKEQIEDEWMRATIWGYNEGDRLPLEFISDPEFQEYLRLKAKFEG